MSNRRFAFLLRALRFDCKETRADRAKTDKLAAIRSVWEAFIEVCNTIYIPGPHLTVHEELLPFRRKCSVNDALRYEKPFSGWRTQYLHADIYH